MLKRPAIPRRMKNKRFQGIAKAHVPGDTAVEQSSSVFLREFHHPLKMKRDRFLQKACNLLEGYSLHRKIEIDADCPQAPSQPKA